MKADSNGKGFTIVELMVAMLAMSILALIVGSLLYFAWSGWARNRSVVAMQRDASLAMRTMSNEIRQSSINDISVEASTSLVCTNRESNRIEFVHSGGNLEMEVDGVPHIRLVEGSVSQFNPTKSTRSIGLELVLSDGHESVVNQVIIFPRNQ